MVSVGDCVLVHVALPTGWAAAQELAEVPEAHLQDISETEQSPLFMFHRLCFISKSLTGSSSHSREMLLP